MANSKDTAKSLDELSPYDYFPYASYIKGRTGGSGWANGSDFKRHKTLAHAKTALRGASYLGEVDKRIYQWDESKQEWQEVV